MIFCIWRCGQTESMENKMFCSNRTSLTSTNNPFQKVSCRKKQKTGKKLSENTASFVRPFPHLKKPGFKKTHHFPGKKNRTLFPSKPPCFTGFCCETSGFHRPFTPPTGRLGARVANDEWQTTLESWKAVAPWLGVPSKCFW